MTFPDIAKKTQTRVWMGDVIGNGGEVYELYADVDGHALLVLFESMQKKFSLARGRIPE